MHSFCICGHRFNRIQDNNKGDPLDKWGKKRKGWIKLHASVDINHVNAQKIAITSAHKHDAQILPLLVTGKEDQVFADKAYDSRKIFNLLDANGTNAIIPLRKNFRTIARGSITMAGDGSLRYISQD